MANRIYEYVVHNLRNPITFRRRLNFSNIVRSNLVIKQTNSQNKQFFFKTIQITIEYSEYGKKQGNLIEKSFLGF